MNILISYFRFPWPLMRGDQLTVWKLIEYLARKHRVTLLCAKADRAADVQRLPSGLAAVHWIDDGLLRRGSRLAGGLLRGRSLQVDAFFSNRNAVKRESLLASEPFDIVYSHYIRSHGHGDFNAHGARKVIGLQLSHQAHFAKAEKNAGNPVLRHLYGLERKRLEHWEGKIASYNDLIHLISERDLARIKGHESWKERVFINPHGVDETHFVPAPEKRVPGRVVFTGNLGFQANEDAILWFAQDIWPRVLASRPDATLQIAGARPTERLRRMAAETPQTTLIPFPKDMADIIQPADVAIDPLRIGAGLQNKILEALSCGVPVVSTTLGNEGVKARDGTEILLADDAATFADAVIRVLNTPALREELSGEARRFITRLWSWDYHFEQLEARWLELKAAAHRPPRCRPLTT